MGTKTYHRGIRDIKIAAWNSENSYGAAYDILGGRNMTVEYVVETDELRGDDVVLDRYAKIIAANVTMEEASVDLEAGNMMMGGTLVSNAQYEDMKLGGDDDVPYIALAGRVVGSGGASDLHIFIPKCRLSGNMRMQAQEGQYILPGADFQGVKEGDVNGVARLRKFVAATALEIPLRTTTGGF
jgi:hypothetical protein